MDVVVHAVIRSSCDAVGSDLDFLIDCTGQRLVPRDPNQIISEIE